MQFFFHLILLSCIFVEYSLSDDNTNYILCTSHCPEITVPFSELSILSTECQANDTNNYESALSCGIEYTIDYDAKSIRISFQVTNDTHNLENQTSAEFLVQSIKLSLQQYGRPNFVNRKYGCNTKEDCARDFYLSTINVLVNDGAANLDLIRIKLHNDSLIVGEKAQRRCTDSNKTGDKTSRSCKNGFCHARIEKYELDGPTNTKTQSCVPVTDPTLISEIEHHSPKSTQKERETLEYTCNKNVCNRNDFISKIQEIINIYIQWKPIDQEAQPNQPNEPINEKSAENLSIQQTISSSILVLFLLIIKLFI
ncbi:unnamed protein product [Adineta steineri]|uniref:Uncharacterized protein n=1 Tax=Adineta steineri TaxID=433720 RepID=A0A818FHG2_9BILA|nr:unnamed protein product [Adineta steineri]